MGEPRFSPSALHATYTRGPRTGNSAPGTRAVHEWHESMAKSTTTHSRVAAMKTLMWRLPGRLHSAGVLTPLVVVVTVERCMAARCSREVQCLAVQSAALVARSEHPRLGTRKRESA